MGVKPEIGSRGPEIALRATREYGSKEAEIGVRETRDRKSGEPGKLSHRTGIQGEGTSKRGQGTKYWELGGGTRDLGRSLQLDATDLKERPTNDN